MSRLPAPPNSRSPTWNVTVILSSRCSCSWKHSVAWALSCMLWARDARMERRAMRRKVGRTCVSILPGGNRQRAYTCHRGARYCGDVDGCFFWFRKQASKSAKFAVDTLFGPSTYKYWRSSWHPHNSRGRTTISLSFSTPYKTTP